MPRTGALSKRNRWSSLTAMTGASGRSGRAHRGRRLCGRGDNRFMSPDDFQAACSALVAARREARVLDDVPASWLPSSPAEAYRLQAAVAAELGVVAGWKVSAITLEQQRAAGLQTPIAGPLLDRWLIDAPGHATRCRAGAAEARRFHRAADRMRVRLSVRPRLCRRRPQPAIRVAKWQPSSVRCASASRSSIRACHAARACSSTWPTA